MNIIILIISASMLLLTSGAWSASPALDNYNTMTLLEGE